MKSVALIAALAAVIPAAFGLTVNTPANVVECEPIQFSWADGTAPYYLTLVPAGQIAATPIKQFPTQNGTTYTWTVDIASGTSFTIALKDSTGATAYSDIVSVQGGTDSSCVNSSVTETGGTSGGSTGSSPSSTGSGSTPTSSGHSGSSGSPTSTASGSTATHSSGAERLGTSFVFGVAGVLGLVGAALF